MEMIQYFFFFNAYEPYILIAEHVMETIKQLNETDTVTCVYLSKYMHAACACHHGNSLLINQVQYDFLAIFATTQDTEAGCENCT